MKDEQHQDAGSLVLPELFEELTYVMQDKKLEVFSNKTTQRQLYSQARHEVRRYIENKLERQRH